MADYNVNWFLNEYPLPIIGQELADELVASGKCTSQNCPNTAKTQKGPEPAKIILTVPFAVVSTLLAADLDGTHVLKIKWDHVDPSSGLEIPSNEVLFECLHVVHVSEVIKHRDNVVEEDLVIVELSDVRHVFQKNTSYGSTQIPSNTNFIKTVAHQIYDNSFKHLTLGSKAVNVSEELFPESAAGVTSYLNQFSVDNYKSDWELLNECCNRTENSFYIDLDGEPRIQRNSRNKNYPFTSPSGYHEKYEFLNDSKYSETLGDLDVNHLDEKWDAVQGFFWTTQAKSNFTNITKPFDELDGPPYGKVVNLFPLSIPISSYSYSGFSSHYRQILDSYIFTINLQKAIDKWVVCYNGVLRADFNSQISTIMYTNNPNGVFTYVDVKFRHGIPFYEFEGPFKDEFVPTAWANIDLTLTPRNWELRDDKIQGINALCPPIPSGMGPPSVNPIPPPECQSDLGCPYIFNFMGFYGTGPVGDMTQFEIPYRYGKADRMRMYGHKTNTPKFFRTLSGNLTVSKTGYYKLKINGKAFIDTSGALIGPPRYRDFLVNPVTTTTQQGYIDDVAELNSLLDPKNSIGIGVVPDDGPYTLVNQPGGDSIITTLHLPCIHFPQNIRPEIVIHSSSASGWLSSNLVLQNWWIEPDMGDSSNNYWNLRVRVTLPYMYINQDITGEKTNDPQEFVSPSDDPPLNMQWTGPGTEVVFSIRSGVDVGEGTIRSRRVAATPNVHYETQEFNTRCSRENISIVLRHKIAPGHAHLSHDVLGKIDFGDSVFESEVDYSSLWFDRKLSAPHDQTDLRLPEGHWRAKIGNGHWHSIPVPSDIEWISKGRTSLVKDINIEKVVYLEEGYTLDLWVHAVSEGDYNDVLSPLSGSHHDPAPLEPIGSPNPGSEKRSTISGPLRIGGTGYSSPSTIELSFISETEPVNDTIEI